MAIKKLSDGPIEMMVNRAMLVDGQYGTQVMFAGQEADEPEDTVLYVSERSAVRQLERLSLSVESCSNVVLRFEQVQKNGKTYNNIYRADPSAEAPVTSNPSAGTVNVQASRPASNDAINPAQVALYEDCLRQAARATITMGDETGLDVSASDVIAAAATLFIQASRR